MSGGIYGGDEVGAIVFDVGSNTVRTGFAGEDCPKGDFQTEMGLCEESMIPENEDSVKSEPSYYIGLETMKPRPGMNVASCLRDGMIDNWDLFEKIIDYSYKRYIQSESLYHPVLFSETPWNTNAKREKLTELMFEKYHVPAFFICKNSVLNAFANGRTSALILDSGAHHTTVVPVCDGYVLQQGVVRSPLGGDFLAAESAKLLEDMNIPIVPMYQIESKEAVGEEDDPIFKKKDLAGVTSSFHNFSLKQLMQDFSASVLQVSDVPLDESSADQMPTVLYEFPNGYNRCFGAERFRLCEGLFDPSQIKGIQQQSNSMLGVANMVANSIGMCDIDQRPSMFSSIVAVGGNTLLQGFIDRLNRDLSHKVPGSMRMKVLAPPTSSERRFSSWIGGSILGSLGSFQQMWISRQEYEETGKIIVDKKCP